MQFLTLQTRFIKIDIIIFKMLNLMEENLEILGMDKRKSSENSPIIKIDPHLIIIIGNINTLSTNNRFSS